MRSCVDDWAALPVLTATYWRPPAVEADRESVDSLHRVAGRDSSALRVVRIVLDHESPRNPGDDVTNPHRIRRQLFESMKRDSDFAACDQRPDPLEGATHTIPSE